MPAASKRDATAVVLVSRQGSIRAARRICCPLCSRTMIPFGRPHRPCRPGCGEAAGTAEFAKRKGGICAASIVCARHSCLFSYPREDGLIASSSITAGSTDDADGADAIFRTCAHPDHSRHLTTFTGKRDLDAQRPEKRLCAPQSTGERAQIFCP
jgi:hypothetical protein